MKAILLIGLLLVSVALVQAFEDVDEGMDEEMIRHFNETLSKAVGVCGNGVVDAGEQCDTGIFNVPKPPSPLSGKQGCCWNDCTLRPWTVSDLPTMTFPNCQRNVFAITNLFSSSTIKVQNMISVEKTVDTCGDLQLKPSGRSPFGTAYFLPAITSSRECQVSIKASINCSGKIVSLEKGTTLRRTCP